MSSRATTGMSRSTQSTTQRRHRSRSTSRYADLEKPKKKKALSATTSLVSIPNTIKLSMLNSGLLSFDKFKLEARDENNSLSQTIPDTPIELRHFVKLCEQRRKFPVLYKLEFQTAIKVETNSCKHATRKSNIEKNQNQKCIPYDYNRVVLEKIDGATDSDYVNASYVDSLLKPNAYIVTQGPTEDTVLNFWRTVWQENVSCIVMLTKTFDFTKVMCVQYWPASKDKDEIYGDVYVGVCKEEQLANFHIRTFRMYRRDGDKIIDEREVLQFHYTEWHSHTCPFSNAILEFRRRVRAVVGNIIKANSQRGPMLVHCNDGGGRSGVYLAIDANLELAEEEDCFHVYGYLKKLRQSRKGLIENVDQYKFVYDTLEEHIVCGNSWFPVTQLSERLKQKSIKEPITKMNDYQREYAQICKQTPRFSIGDCAGGHRGDNREKNRDVLCVPPDNFRPYLTSFQGNAFTDYINSVFVDGYTRPREYIVTEWPLKQTLGEFWSLVYDQECSAVVVLCNPPPASQQYPSFWPEGKTPKKYGPVFTVNHKSHHHYSNIRTWQFEINKKIVSLTELMAGVKAPSKNVQLFHLTCWPMGHKVPSSTNSLVALMNMVERWRQKSDYGPVCVVSPDGRSRSGVYCAANACIEQVIEHGEVDIFQAVKTVRRHRPQLVENITEYKYCYDLVLHYVLHYLNKDLKEKKFIEFGRGKSIPLTPENSNSDLPNEQSNAGRVVVKKRIAKIEKGDSFHISDKDSSKLLDNNRIIKLVDKNGKIIERKKKGRLYSLGGNDQPKRNHRGRLDRLKTVGTFDLGTEMCVLSEVARNLNEQIISGELMQQQQQQQDKINNINRRLSAIPDVTGTNQGLSGLTSPINNCGGSAGTSSSGGGGGGGVNNNGVKRDFSKSTSNFSSKSICNNKLLLDPNLKNNCVYFDQNNKNDLVTDVNIKTKKSKSISVPGVRTQHSAEDYKHANELIGKNSGTKPRSLSTGSYLTNSYQNVDRKCLPNRLTSPLNSIIDSNIDEIESPMFDVRKHLHQECGTNDSNKIEDDIRSYEDNKKNVVGDEIFSKTFANTSRKPLLRKSRRIVRSDSEFLGEEFTNKNEIILYANTDIQIHNEQNTDDKSLRHDSVESGCKSRKDSSDLDEICSAKSNLKSTDESSRNISTDELDTVFSDSTDLEQLEKDYRDHLKSNLQREYKSDGDTLDEVGRKRNEYGKWKNQSFDNDIDLFPIKIQQDTITNDNTKIAITTHDTLQKNKTLKLSTDSTNEILIDKSESITSLKDILSNINSPKENSSDNSSFNLTATNQVNRPSDLEISKIMSTTKPSSEGSITSLLEKRFGKFKKINKLLKSKRFSTSILYEKKKTSSNILRTQEVLRYNDQTNKNLTNVIDNNNKYSRSSPAKSNISGSKSSIYSSKASLFSSKGSKCSKGSKGFSFLGRKSSMFSDESHSNSELNSRTSSGARLNEISKSNSEISKYKPSPTRMSIKRSNKEQKNNSTACLNLETSKCHSPLSEEFYNKTGSVRLSAMELFEKFCSEDFGGLYKHENFKNEERFDTERSPFLNRYEYIQRMASRGLGAIRKYPAPRNVRLLKQKSEPKFALQNDLLSEDVKGESGTMYYHKEEEEEEEEEEDEYPDNGQYYNEQNEYYDGEFYEGEDDEEYEEEECEEEEEEEEEDEELEVEVEDDVCAGAEGEILNERELNDIPSIDFYENDEIESSCSRRQEYFSLEKQTTIIEVLDYNTSGITKYQLESNIDGTMTKNINIDVATSTDSEVDEIYLMPDNSRCDTFFDRDQFTNDRPPLIRVAGIDRSLNNLDGVERSISMDKFGSDEILTVYRICSKDDIINMTEFSVSDLDLSYDKNCDNSKSINLLETKQLTKSTPSFMNYEIRNEHNNECSIECVVNHYVKNSTVDNNLPILDPNFIKSDCTIFDRTDSIELLSNSSGTIRSGSTLTDYAFDTVRNMNLDSCSTSKLSLSLKSEVFEEFTLTPDELSKPIKNYDVEDFTLTPEESVDENNGLFSSQEDESKMQQDIVNDGELQLIGDQSESQHNVLTMLDKFINNERSPRTCEITEMVKENLPNLTCKDTNIFNFENIDSVGIFDLDDNESVNDEQRISAFTNEITKEFDLLFYRAEEESKIITEEIQENNLNDLSNNIVVFERIPTRYSMQKLEPINIEEISTEITNDNKIICEQQQQQQQPNSNSINTDSNKTDNKNSSTRLKSNNRSQSLGNLSKKTRCFPL